MRITVHLNTSASLPSAHGYALGSVLYNSLAGDDRRIIGESGNPRLVSLTNLVGPRITSSNRTLHIDGPCRFSLATPADTTRIYSALGKRFSLLGAEMEVLDYEVHHQPEHAEWWCASPESPLLTKSGDRWTDPNENPDACGVALRTNLMGRWERLAAIPELKELLQSWTGQSGDMKPWAEANLPEFQFPTGTRTHNRPIKGGSVRAWSGAFRMIGHPAWTRVLWHTGLGPKTIFGFGLVQPMRAL